MFRSSRLGIHMVLGSRVVATPSPVLFRTATVYRKSFHTLHAKKHACADFLSTSVRYGSKERAGKAVKPGAAIILDDAPHKVMRIIQGKRGKGGGYVRAFMKNIVTKSTTEKTYLVDETVEFADLEKEEVQYSWSDGETFHFMNTKTYEQVSLSKEDVIDHEFLTEGIEVKVQKFRDQVIGVEMPKVAEFQVLTTDPTKTSSGYISATIGIGAEIFVPKFVEPGTKIRVNLEEKVYSERVN